MSNFLSLLLKSYDIRFKLKSVLIYALKNMIKIYSEIISAIIKRKIKKKLYVYLDIRIII